MNIEITARHFDLTPELKEHIENEVSGLTRYFENIISSEVILDVEKYRQTAEIKVKVYNASLNGKSDTDDMYASIDKVIDKLERQIRGSKSSQKGKERASQRLLPDVSRAIRDESGED